jgi:hypothetical protein
VVGDIEGDYTPAGINLVIKARRVAADDDPRLTAFEKVSEPPVVSIAHLGVVNHAAVLVPSAVDVGRIAVNETFRVVKTGDGFEGVHADYLNSAEPVDDFRQVLDGRPPSVYVASHKPGSDDWISSNAKAAYKLVLLQIVESEAWTEHGIPYPMERVVEVWRELRKVPKARLKCEVSLKHGSQCFYAHRGVGACSDEVDLDRILPEVRGGEYTVENCVIACSAHNRSRGSTPIEAFLAAAGRPSSSSTSAGV